METAFSSCAADRGPFLRAGGVRRTDAKLRIPRIAPLGGYLVLLVFSPAVGLAAPGDLIRRIVSPEVQPGVNFGEVIAADGHDILVGAFIIFLSGGALLTTIGRHRTVASGPFSVKTVALPLVWCVLSLTARDELYATTIFWGPTPYSSQADSPFDLSGPGTSFFLEDFEDGELNTPGIFQPLIPATHAIVVSPGPTTDSVDGDAGPLDGNGNSGHSLASGMSLVQPTDPERVSWFIRFAFDRDQLGYLPNAFGFVWTDGVQDSTVKIELFDEDFNVFATHEYSQFFGDEVFTGTTPEDRFLGVVSDQEISWVRITSRHVGDGPPLEIDHVQYGVVPEPSGMVMVSAILLVATCVALRSCC